MKAYVILTVILLVSFYVYADDNLSTETNVNSSRINNEEHVFRSQDGLKKYIVKFKSDNYSMLSISTIDFLRSVLTSDISDYEKQIAIRNYLRIHSNRN